MTNKLIWGILAGAVLGIAVGSNLGNPPISITIFVAVGAAAAGIWRYIDTNRRD